MNTTATTTARHPISGAVFPKGNGKLKKARSLRRQQARRWGVQVYNWNLRAIDTCPGRTPLCESLCYADKGRYTLQIPRHVANREIADSREGIIERVENLPHGAWVRIHTSGDFYSARYVDTWRMAALLRPDVRFWGYTRSFAVARILPSLERLRALPNVQLFASIDSSSTATVPTGWRVAAMWIHGESQPGGLVCPEQTGAMSDCADCGFCVVATRGDVTFIQH